MIKNKGEQATEKPEAETAERKDDLAGFKNSTALAAAYKSLQAEFTKRSQRLKDMERELELSRVENESPREEPADEACGVKQPHKTDFDSFIEQFPEADAASVVRGVVTSGDFALGGFTREYVKQLKAEIDTLKEEAASEEIITKKAMENGKITEAIVKEYLKAISDASRALPPITEGYEPVVPPSRPKSIREAGKMAGDIFKFINR